MSYIPSSGAGGGWTTTYSVDFSSLATGSHPGGDGTVTIDGKTWYAQNVANSDEMRTVNGEGLVIDPNGTSSTLFNGTRDCPQLLPQADRHLRGSLPRGRDRHPRVRPVGCDGHQ